jgi:hypothetical protein
MDKLHSLERAEQYESQAINLASESIELSSQLERLFMLIRVSLEDDPQREEYAAQAYKELDVMIDSGDFIQMRLAGFILKSWVAGSERQNHTSNAA